MSDYYILEGHETRPVDSLQWSRWIEGNRDKKQVALDKIGDVEISTVFLGLNHAWGNGPPLLFETMVSGGPLDGEADRYTTWEQAEAGHNAMVKRAKQKC